MRKYIWRIEAARSAIIDKMLRYVFFNMDYCDENAKRIIVKLYERFYIAEYRRSVRIFSLYRG